jgi:BolA family transcriptional regulator, general stress-responsive regulator
MIKLFEEIKKKINKELEPEEISIINNSHLHTKHKSFNPEKYHLKIIIKSSKLRKMDKITSHKLIFSILKSEMINKIHALEISIN